MTLLPDDAPKYSTDDWATPWSLVRELEREFGRFELDPCAVPETAKADRYFTPEQDGLSRLWAPARTFCNPPYSQIVAWIRKARQEAKAGALVVMLIPVRTDRHWWHDELVDVDIRFLRGRVQFVRPDATHSRPVFSSALAIFRARS